MAVWFGLTLVEMRGLLIALTLVGAACGNHGVAVVVTSSVPDVAAVRLYVGTGSATTATLTNVTAVAEQSAKYWTRDPDNETDLHTGFKDKTTFYYDTDVGAPAVIAVGYDGSGNPIAAGVHVGLLPATDNNTFAVTSIDLAMIGTFAEQASSPVALSVWSPPTSSATAEDAECAGIVTADGPVFIVRDQDQDCDGNIDGQPEECTPNTYLGEGASATDGLCVIGGPNAFQCRVGGKPCIDKNATAMYPAGSCVPSNTCMPVGVCTACQSDDYNCALGQGSSIRNSYTCNIQVVNGALCSGQAPIALPRPPTGGYACETHGAKLLLADQNSPTGDDMLKEGGLTIAATLDGSASCAGSLKYSGTPAQANIPALITFPLTNNANVALPIEFQFAPSVQCSDAITKCTLDVSAFDDAAETECAAGWDAVTTVGAPPAYAADPDPSFLELGTQTIMFFATKTGAISKSILVNNGFATSTDVFVPPAGTTYSSPEVSSDGMRMVVTVTTTTGGATVLALSTATTPGQFTTLQPLADATSQGLHFLSATFEADPTKLIASAASAGPAQLYELAITTVTIANAMLIVLDDATGTGANDHPHLSKDGTELYFDFTPLGGVSKVKVASRRSTSDAFTTSTDVTLTTLYNSEPWVDDTGTLMYLSNGAVQTSSRLLSTATRSPLP